MHEDCWSASRVHAPSFCAVQSKAVRHMTWGAEWQGLLSSDNSLSFCAVSVRWEWNQEPGKYLALTGKHPLPRHTSDTDAKIVLELNSWVLGSFGDLFRPNHLPVCLHYYLLLNDSKNIEGC